MYETMVFWETVNTGADQRPVSGDFAEIWRAAEKVVYSRTLQTVSSARTRIEREFEPDAIRWLKDSAEADITTGGAELAGEAIAAGLIDECHLFLGPIVVGGGKRALPDAVRVQLEPLDERRFLNGVAYLRYGVSGLTETAQGRERRTCFTAAVRIWTPLSSGPPCAGKGAFRRRLVWCPSGLETRARFGEYRRPRIPCSRVGRIVKRARADTASLDGQDKVAPTSRSPADGPAR
jgi:dihydrofolate reductase